MIDVIVLSIIVVIFFFPFVNSEAKLFMERKISNNVVLLCLVICFTVTMNEII